MRRRCPTSFWLSRSRLSSAEDWESALAQSPSCLKVAKGLRVGSTHCPDPFINKLIENLMAAELIAKASWYILENAGRVAAMEFHREVGTLSNSSAASVADPWSSACLVFRSRFDGESRSRSIRHGCRELPGQEATSAARNTGSSFVGLR